MMQKTNNKNKPVLLLSGTPASGKDTISNLLVDIDSRFRHFKKHRGSNQPKDDNTYIHVSFSQFSALSDEDEFVQFHSRYGRGYGVSRTELERHWQQGEIPIIHVGKYENIEPFKKANLDVSSVLLLVSLSETKRRLTERHPGDTEEVEKRLAAYHEERQELASLIASGDTLDFDVILDNSGLDAQGVAEDIVKFSLGNGVCY